MTWLLLAVIAFGTIGMAYEQRRANEGIFVPFPSPQTYHVQPAPPAKSF
jgi:hypothetical protein